MFSRIFNIFILFTGRCKGILWLPAMFLFTTFVNDKNIDQFLPEPSQRITGVAGVNVLSQSVANLSRSYDAYLTHCVDNGILPGAAMSIILGNDIQVMKGYGVKRQGSPDSVDEHTTFRIGSVSKGFASVLAGLILHEHQISWEGHIADFMPGFHHRDTGIFNSVTVRNILSHTSGFPIHTFTDLLDGNIPYRQIQEQLKAVPFSTSPGQVYSYQNVVFSLINEVLQSITGEEYVYLLREKLLYPLQMKNASSEYVSLMISGNYASPHMHGRGTWIATQNNTRYYASAPASGINASIADMTRWLLALNGYEPEVVDPEVLREVFMPVVEIPMRRGYKKAWGGADNLYYALGWRVVRVGDKQIVFHGGHVQGFRAEIGFCPEDKVGIVMLFNANTSVVNNLLPEFFRQLYGSQVPEFRSPPI
jgi:beta-lactamase class C